MIDSRGELLVAAAILLLRGKLNIWYHQYHTRKDVKY